MCFLPSRLMATLKKCEAAATASYCPDILYTHITNALKRPSSMPTTTDCPGHSCDCCVCVCSKHFYLLTCFMRQGMHCVAKRQENGTLYSTHRFAIFPLLHLYNFFFGKGFNIQQLLGGAALAPIYCLSRRLIGLHLS